MSYQNDLNYNQNLYFNNIHQQNHLRNNWNKREYNENSDDNQKGKISIHNRNRTPNYKNKNYNNFDRHMQSYEKNGYGCADLIINDYNEDYMNWDNLNYNRNRMKEKKGRTKDDFYTKQAVNTKTQIPAEKNNKMSDFDREILKIFIYIYYYEKIAWEKNIFNNEEDFYLINPKWLKRFKEFYSYDKLKKRFDNLSKVYNYNISDYGIKFILETLSAENILSNVEIFPDLKDIKLINTVAKLEKGIIYTNPGIIIPGKIIDIIK